MGAYRIHYIRHDPVYGTGWVVAYYSRISAKRTIRAATKDEAGDLLVKIISSERPDSKIEIKVGGIVEVEK